MHLPCLLPSFIHSLIPFFNHFLALTPTANRKGRQQCAHAPHPRPLSPSFLRGEGGQSVKRSWPPTLDCDDLSSLWISNAASLVTRLHPNSLHPPLGGSAASPGELPGRGYSRDAFKSDAPISEPTLSAEPWGALGTSLGDRALGEPWGQSINHGDEPWGQSINHRGRAPIGGSWRKLKNCGSQCLTVTT
jgi:hypothetical protein